MPLKSVGSVNTLTQMKRENRNVAWYLTQGFYSNTKEETYHPSGSYRSPSRTKSRNNSASRSKLSAKSGQSRNKHTATPKRRVTSRGSSRARDSPSKSKGRKNSIKIVKGSSPTLKNKNASAVSLINPARLSTSNLSAPDMSAKKIHLQDGAQNGGGRSQSRLKPSSSKQFFDKDLTFTPQINKKSKQLDRRRLGNEGFDTNTNDVDRIGLLHLRVDR